MLTVKERGKIVRQSKGEVYDYTYRGAFCRLWDRLNGDRAERNSNPWVWALTFRRVAQVQAHEAAND